MVTRALKIAVVIGFIFGLKYLLPSSPPFPTPPPDAVQSQEPADSETPLRRAYFTNYTREQVVEHYKTHFARRLMFRLNYPPEDAQTLIRDQTRSYYLEELVHPLRESLFINGFIPQQAKDDIWYKGEHFQQKITIRYVPSVTWSRLLVEILVFILIGVMINEFGSEISTIRKWAKR
jgi:hypothetical protein